MRKRVVFMIVLALGLSAAAFAGEGKKPKSADLLTLENKPCGYWIRYPKKSKLEYPSDCALKIILHSRIGQDWMRQASLTVYTAPAGQTVIGEKPDGDPSPAGFLMVGDMKFSKTLFLDAAMSHRYITVLYEGQGNIRKYRLEGRLTAVVPEVIDESIKNWNPVRSTEKIFDGMVSNFRPLE